MENLIELNENELKEIEGGLVFVFAIPLLIKGVAIGFAAAAAVYGAIELGHSIGSK